MGSMSVSSCRCCNFVSCVHPVAVHNAEFCMANHGPGCKRRLYGRGILQSRSHDCFIGSHECLLFTHPVAVPSTCVSRSGCRLGPTTTTTKQQQKN